MCLINIYLILYYAMLKIISRAIIVHMIIIRVFKKSEIFFEVSKSQ